ncbi:hypothetical protein ACWXWK_23640, partial [Pantoea ananatis]
HVFTLPLLVELKEWKGDGAGGDGGWGDDEDLGTGYKASTDGDFGSDDFSDDGCDGDDDSNSGGDYDF